MCSTECKKKGYARGIDLDLIRFCKIGAFEILIASLFSSIFLARPFNSLPSFRLIRARHFFDHGHSISFQSLFILILFSNVRFFLFHCWICIKFRNFSFITIFQNIILIKSTYIGSNVYCLFRRILFLSLLANIING